MNTNAIDLNKNILFYKNNDFELKELLYYLYNVRQLLRSNINLSKNISFGFELEFENANLYEINKFMDYYVNNDWELKKDGTVVTGKEVTTPILHDDYTTWYNLCDVCEILSKYSCIGENCGGHIHIGTHIFENEDNFTNFIKVWLAVEDIVFKFCYGEYLNERPNILNYAMPLSKNILSGNIELNLNYLFGYVGYTSVDCIHLKGAEFDKYDTDNTIEFRCPNGTLKPEIWQNNLNVFAKMIEYSKNNYDDDLIMYIIKKNKHFYNEYNLSNEKLIYMYNNINVKKAFLLCDMIFDNNLDKIYFLKQYFKYYKEKKIFYKEKVLVK